jgi:tetratricopeptide (TPR) repeat protein
MSQPRLVLRALVAGALAVAVPTTSLVGERAAAAQPAPRIDKKKLAKQYVDSGLAAQAAGDYDTALTFYSKAYEQVPHPLLLFNMAQVHRLAGRATEARDLYLKYLEAEPQGVQARTARDWLAVLEGQISAETRKANEARRAEEARKAEAARKADAAREAEDARKAEEAAAAEAAEQARRREEQRRRSERASSGRGLRLGGMVAGGLGLVGIGAGVAFNLRASSLSDDLSRPGATYDPDKDSDGESAEKLMYISFAAGSALLVSGAALYFLGHRARANAEHIAVVPAVSPDGFGLVVRGGLP